MDKQKVDLRKDIKLMYDNFLPYIKQHKWYYLMVVIGMILAAVGAAGSAYIMKPLIDNVFKAKDELMLYLVPMALIVVFLLKDLGLYMQNYFLAYINSSVENLLRQRIVTHLMQLEIDFFNKTRTGALMARLNDVGTATTFATTYIMNLANTIIMILSYSVVIIYHGSFLALIAFIVMPLSLIPIRLIAKKMRKLANQGFQAGADMSSRMLEKGKVSDDNLT